MSKKLIIIIIAVVLVLIIGGVAAFFLLRGDGEEKEVIIDYYEFSFGEQYSNLADETKIIKYNVTLEYTDEEMLAIIEKNKTKLLNVTLEYFGQLSVENADQEDVREDLLELFIEVLESDSEILTNIYFIEFIIQG